MSNAQTQTSTTVDESAVMDEVAEKIGERLARVDEPGQAPRQLVKVTDLTTALVEGMVETKAAGIGPVRQAVRHYLQKYDRAELPQTPAVISVLRDH